MSRIIRLVTHGEAAFWSEIAWSHSRKLNCFSPRCNLEMALRPTTKWAEMLQFLPDFQVILDYFYKLSVGNEKLLTDSVNIIHISVYY